MTEWMKQAACKGIDPDLFFPERGGDTASAKAVCAVCPVKAQCLELALATWEHHGVWGGTSERERRNLRRKRGLRRPLPPAQCGTTAGYWAHRRAGETPCGACAEVRNATQWAQIKDGPISHGSLYGWRQHKARGDAPCYSCQEAYESRKRYPGGSARKTA